MGNMGDAESCACGYNVEVNIVDCIYFFLFCFFLLYAKRYSRVHAVHRMRSFKRLRETVSRQ